MARLSSLSRKEAKALDGIRQLETRDLDRIRVLHNLMGAPYDLPNLADPTFVVTAGLVDEGGVIQAAAALRLTSEAYLLLNPEWGDAADRWLNVLALHESVRVGAKKLGLVDVHAFLPPNVRDGFKRRLQSLGWVREPFEPWVRSTDGATWPEG